MTSVPGSCVESKTGEEQFLFPPVAIDPGRVGFECAVDGKVT